MARKSSQKTELTVSNETLLRIIGFLLATVVFIELLDILRHPLTLIFMSFFLALVLNPAVSWLSKRLKSKSRVRATAIAYSAVVAVLVLFFVLIVPPLVSQTSGFVRDVPDTLESIKNDDGSIGSFVRRYQLEEQLQRFADDWTRNLGSTQGPVFTTANRVFLNLVSIISVIVLTFMMLIEGPKWVSIVFNRLPTKRREHAMMLSKKMNKVVTGFVNGQVIVASIGAICALVALVIASTIFGVSINAIALAGIVFLFSLIPTIGVIISTILVTFFLVVESVPLAVTMLIYFIVYQQIENASVQPYIQSRVNELTPLLVFIAVIIGVSVAGVLGGFLAIPIAGCAKVLIDDYLSRRDDDGEPSIE